MIKYAQSLGTIYNNESGSLFYQQNCITLTELDSIHFYHHQV